MRKAKIMTQSEVKTNPGKELQQFVAEFYDKYAAKYGFIGNYFNPEYASDCIDLEQETDLDISSNYVASIDQKKQVDHYQLIGGFTLRASSASQSIS